MIEKTFLLTVCSVLQKKIKVVDSVHSLQLLPFDHFQFVGPLITTLKSKIEKGKTRAVYNFCCVLWNPGRLLQKYMYKLIPAQQA